MVNGVGVFEPYKACVSKETLEKWNNIIGVWNGPKSPPDGGRVVDEIKERVAVSVE